MKDETLNLIDEEKVSKKCSQNMKKTEKYLNLKGGNKLWSRK